MICQTTRNQMRYSQVFVFLKRILHFLYIVNGMSRADVGSSPFLKNGEACSGSESPLKCPMNWTNFQVPVPLPFHCSTSDLSSRCLDVSRDILHSVKKFYVDGKVQSVDGKTLSSMSCSRSISSGKEFDFELNSIENIYAVAIKLYHQQGDPVDFDVTVGLNRSSEEIDVKTCQYKTIVDNWRIFYCLSQENVEKMRIEFQELGFFGNSVFISASRKVDFCSVLFIPYPIKPCGPPGHYEEMTSFSSRLGVYFPDEFVFYSCKDPTFKIIGSALRRCQNNGQWSGKPPFCAPVTAFTPSSYSFDWNGRTKFPYDKQRAVSINNQRKIYFFSPTKLLTLGIRFWLKKTDQDQLQNNVLVGGIQFNRTWLLEQCDKEGYCPIEYSPDPSLENFHFESEFEINFNYFYSKEIKNVQVFGFREGTGSIFTKFTSYSSTTRSFRLEKPALIFFVRVFGSQYDSSQISEVSIGEFELVRKAGKCDRSVDCSLWFSTSSGQLAFGSSVEIKFYNQYLLYSTNIEIYGPDNGGKNCPLIDRAAFTEEDQISCLPGFHKQIAYSDEMPCFGRNSNTDCSRKFCPLPTTLENGSWKYANDMFTVNNYSIEYECFQGFLLQGKKVLTCTNGQWTPNTPKCLDDNCPLPPSIANGHWNYTKGTFSDSIKSVEYECSEGFYMEGQKILTCSNGQWTPNTPKCLDNCPSPPSIANGHWNYTKDGSSVSMKSVQYECSEGFYMEGQKILKCSKGQWSSNIPICKEMPCQPWPVVANGDLIYQTGNLTVTVECSKGFQLQEKKTICTYSGWIYIIQNCTEIQEPVPQSLSNKPQNLLIILGIILILLLLFGRFYLKSRFYDRSRKHRNNSGTKEPINANSNITNQNVNQKKVSKKAPAEIQLNVEQGQTSNQRASEGNSNGQEPTYNQVIPKNKRTVRQKSEKQPKIPKSKEREDSEITYTELAVASNSNELLYSSERITNSNPNQRKEDEEEQIIYSQIIVENLNHETNKSQKNPRDDTTEDVIYTQPTFANISQQEDTVFYANSPK